MTTLLLTALLLGLMGCATTTTTKRVTTPSEALRCLADGWYLAADDTGSIRWCVQDERALQEPGR